jgi:hypothetical protein
MFGQAVAFYYSMWYRKDGEACSSEIIDIILTLTLLQRLPSDLDFSLVLEF